MEPKNQQVAKHSRFVHFTFCLWLASVGVLITVLLVYTGPSIITVFESLEVDLPGVTVLSLNTGVFLRTGLGLLIALGVVVVLALPFVLGSRSPATAKVLREFNVKDLSREPSAEVKCDECPEVVLINKEAVQGEE